MNYSFKSVRDRIRNKSRDTGIKADVLYRRYFLERFIARAAISKHSKSIIIKGGMLISAISGVDMRATRDLDATVRGNNLEMHDYLCIVRDIIAVDLDDNVRFEQVGAQEIMLDNRYPCCRVHLRALFGTMNGKIEVDLTSGDVITPKEVTFGFPTLLGDEKIPVLAYTLETVLAEKTATVLDLGVFNSRAKDFYDIYLLTTSLSDKIDPQLLKEAVSNTLRQRGKERLLANSCEIVRQIIKSSDIQAQWRRYQNEYPYAAGIEFSSIVSAFVKLFRWLGIEITLNST